LILYLSDDFKYLKKNDIYIQVILSMTHWNTRVKVQYISDIHLEFKKYYPKLKKLAENLCLAGDIGHPHTPFFKEFIRIQCQNYTNVFMVSGNHEYWMKNKKPPQYIMSEINQELEKMDTEIDNFWYLNNTNVFVNSKNQVFREIPEIIEPDLVNIIGTTLWTDILPEISHRINDYKNILVKPNEYITPFEVKRLHQESVKFIINCMEMYKDIPAILVTHHAPHHLMNGKYFMGELTSAFSTDLSFLLKDPIKISISGHIHSVCSIYINGVFLTSNEYGYNKDENTGYDPYTSVVEI
jgi:predicted MPP superfamily phosphohydrolase